MKASLLQSGSNANVALIVDQFPLPPRNGITIPAAQILQWMQMHGFSVDIWLLGDDEVTDAQVRLLRGGGVRLCRPNVKPISRLRRFWAEMWGCAYAFDRWLPADDGRRGHVNYALTVSTPISVGSFAPAFLRAERNAVVINDSYFAVLSTYPFRPWSLRMANRVRAQLVRRAEHAILDIFDDVLVQTQVDRDWLCDGAGERLRSKTHYVHNAVSDALLKLPYTGTLGIPRLLFVGDLSNTLYQKNLTKIHDVWKRVIRRVPGALFQIAGSGLRADSELFRRLIDDDSVEIMGFVPDIVNVYSGARAAVAVIDKSYGFMNKVAEAVSCGIPVVGDKSAFNGLSSLVEKGGVVIANSAVELEREIISLLCDDARSAKMSKICKEFAMEELSYRSLFDKLDNIMM